MRREEMLDQAARWIVDAAYSDSLVKLDERKTRAVLAEDLRLLPERVLTAKECDELVMGDDAGIVPEELRRLLPKTDAYLNEHW